MQATELLTADFPVLSENDPIQKAVDIFMDTCVCHIPVVKKGVLQGILPVDFLVSLPDKKGTVKDFKEDWLHVFAFRDFHGISVFELIAKHELSGVPVVDETNNYLGFISTQDLLARLSTYYSLREVGGIMVLSFGARDYDLSEVARIIESNNAKILMLILDQDEATERLKLTIKVNTLDLRHILATFERYKYVVDFYYPYSVQKDELKDRYDFFMKLFDIE